mmetsp:Transcript_77146/g.178944  ORF Transcript_77146/g.178944 Transcript_77146/m.178944 type:complete len:146 (-) Transcript_77146:481-918(-)
MRWRSARRMRVTGGEAQATPVAGNGSRDVEAPCGRARPAAWAAPAVTRALAGGEVWPVWPPVLTEPTSDCPEVAGGDHESEVDVAGILEMLGPDGGGTARGTVEGVHVAATLLAWPDASPTEPSRRDPALSVCGPAPWSQCCTGT